MRAALTQKVKKTRSVVLCGLGGFGKSRLAMYYKEQYGYEYSHFLWINAATYENALKSFRAAAESIFHLKMGNSSASGFPEGESEDCIFTVKRFLAEESNPAWLFVLDGIDDLDGYQPRNFLPSCAHGTIIVTTTRSELATAWGMPTVYIGSLDDVAGSQILLRNMSEDNRSDDSE